ncbi:hypothetical protein [Flavobacterium sp.]|uniref:hypothetical protein n=1 Tax=Flavobacterium sp. TaxID=239 RepID=UPI0025D227F7|nr:hypothetical protein [Flavobacterium sp.]
MKKIILLSLLLLCNLSYCQSNINGIGRFKVGMNISIIDSLKNEGYAYKEFDKVKDQRYFGSEQDLVNRLSRNESKKIMKSEMTIYEKKVSDNYQDYGYSPLVKEKRVFIIKYYNVADIDIDLMELDFYNDKLYEIKISENPLLNLSLMKKYKYENKVELGEKYNCYNAYREIEYQEQTLKTIFRNDEIYAYSLQSRSYHNCKELNILLCVVNDKTISENVFQIEKKIFIDLMNDPNRSDLQSLKKL